ncbi:hypothetical protein ED733_007361 [Metarhizium rileyi]|uniref:F-box domain-containing protein n=1 Tax=Metarhizium rileyi (strain RCEF 4871) TaxID=1649241 RepID=A0A5C6GPA4_METRR|nr:hypothetical protein ED733_007361 [Metarhizium rileyi]
MKRKFSSRARLSPEIENARHQWKCEQYRSLGHVKKTKHMSGSEMAEREKQLQHYCDTSYFGKTGPDREPLTMDYKLDRVWSTGPRYVRIDTRALSRSQTEAWPETDGLGALSRNRLPRELLDNIVSKMTIATLGKFKLASRSTCKLILEHFQAKFLYGYASKTIRCFYAAKLAHTVTVETLLAKLQNSLCVECGDFGGYMYMLTLERVCCWCMQNTARFAVVRELEALGTYCLTPETLRSIPQLESFKTVISKSSDGEFDEGKYLPLFDRDSVIKAAIACHGSEEATREARARRDPDILLSYWKYIEERERKHDEERFWKWRERELSYRASERQRIADKASQWEEYLRRREMNDNVYQSDDDDPSTEEDTHRWPEIEPEEVALSKELESGKEHRRIIGERQRDTYNGDFGSIKNACMLGMIRVPWLNKSSLKAEWGFHCLGCAHTLHDGNKLDSTTEKKMHTRRDFLVSTFEEHLREFGPVRDGRHHIDDCCKKKTCEKGPDSPCPEICQTLYWINPYSVR